MKKSIARIIILSSAILPITLLFQNFSTYFNLTNPEIKVLADPAVFNCDFYSAYYSDIKNAFQNDCNATTEHSSFYAHEL